MEELIHLALHAEDERVRSVCCVAVLDRAYGRPREAESTGAAGVNMESLLTPMRAYLGEREEEQ